jgi:hypothetical protein
MAAAKRKNDLNFENFVPQEPQKQNRFIIRTEGVDVPPYLFRDYKLYNDGSELIFETKFFETVNYTFNPADFFKISGVTLEFLDPTGAIINELSFEVKGSNFEQIGDYSSDELKVNKMKFIVDVNKLHLNYQTVII